MTSCYDSYNYQKYWQNRRYENRAERLVLEKFFQEIKRKNEKTILDIGAGFGRLTPCYAGIFKNVIFTEPSQKLTTQAQQKLKKFDNINYRVSRIETIKADTYSPQVVIMVRVAHHLNDLDQIFKKIAQMLPIGGFFILEFANKINFKSRLKTLFSGNIKAFNTLASIDRRSPHNINQNSILFLNHHPEKIRQLLEKNGFEIKEKLSVSNFRSPFLKKIIPLKILLFLEKISQRPLAGLNFGPSIFLLARKR